MDFRQTSHLFSLNRSKSVLLIFPGSVHHAVDLVFTQRLQMVILRNRNVVLGKIGMINAKHDMNENVCLFLVVSEK